MESNILFIDKPKDVFSRQYTLKVCNQIKIKAKKTGIEGILDPFASGLLIAATGYATRYLSYFLSLPKTYEASLRLGEMTDTLDLTGKIIQSEKKIPRLSQNMINKALKELTGEILQQPPIFSNIKINGVPARKLTRQGKPPELSPRKVNILKLELLEFTSQTIKFLVEVNSGTYIRSLGLSIAEKLGTIGHLFDLRRTKIGKFCVEDIKDSFLLNHSAEISNKLIRIKKKSIADTLYWFDQIILPSQEIIRLQEGRKIFYTNKQNSEILNKIYKIKNINGEFYGLAIKKDDWLFSHKMLPLSK